MRSGSCSKGREEQSVALSGYGNATGRAECESDSAVVRFPRTRLPPLSAAHDNPAAPVFPSEPGPTIASLTSACACRVEESVEPGVAPHLIFVLTFI